jgi:glyoxylase-like metal-dependent hydrolase (beta-lactamase superfamily II)
MLGHTPILAILLCLIGTPVAHSQTSASPSFTLKPLANNVWAAIATPKGNAGANAGFVIGDDGVAVVDSFQDPEAARQLLAQIRQITKLPIKFVINTHYHLDHVAGNSVFQDAGAVVIGQRNVREWIHTENLKFFGPNIRLEQKSFVENLAAPEVIYDSALVLFLGSRRIQVTWKLGHTGGDSIVQVPDAKVVFCGDLFWRRTLPNLIDASTAPWTVTLDFLARANSAGSFVPGHGNVGTADDIKEFREYLVNLRKIVGEAQGQGKTGDVLLEAVLPALTQAYGKWDFFDYFARKNITDTDIELRGKKKIPAPVDIE